MGEEQGRTGHGTGHSEAGGVAEKRQLEVFISYRRIEASYLWQYEAPIPDQPRYVSTPWIKCTFLRLEKRTFPAKGVW